MMASSLSSRAETKLGRALNDIESTAKCLVEGGHLTARVRHAHGLSDRRFAWRKDECYLVVVKDYPDRLPGEFLRGPAKDDVQTDVKIEYVVVRPEPDEVIELPSRTTGVGDVYTISYKPSKTQQNSLEFALGIAQKLSGRVKKVQLAILIGDLDIPPSLRRSLKWMLPESYQEMLDSSGLGIGVKIFSEAACRNQGKRRLLDPRKSDFQKREDAERIYKDHGYTLFRDFGCGSLNLCSDYALKKLREFPYLVAVTKDAKTPTCGLILAGKLFSISKEGFTHFLSVYDECDDPRIRRKNIDGFLILTHMARDRSLEVILCTLNTVGREQQFEIDEISCQDLKGPGGLNGLEELLELTRRKNLDPGLDYVDAMSSSVCCRYSPEQISTVREVKWP